MKRIIVTYLFLCCAFVLSAQLTYGTTGLLHAPSAEMQKDKTIMLGANFMNKEITPPTWYYHTYNYYLNVTFFPWLEVAYTCTLFKAEAFEALRLLGFYESGQIFLCPTASFERRAILEVYAGCGSGNIRPVYFFRRWRNWFIKRKRIFQPFLYSCNQAPADRNRRNRSTPLLFI